MSDKEVPDSWVEVWMSPRLYGSIMTGRGRFKLTVIAIVIALCTAIGGHMYGRYLATSDIRDRDFRIQQLQSEIQKLQGEITERDGKLVAVQSRLTRLQEGVEALVPTKNTYTLNPDQSLMVANGLLSIGLVGLPRNSHININVNGKQQVAAVGDVIRPQIAPGLECLVRVQSFDMFKAVITAFCGKANADQKGSSND
jgi:hypothetical protein